MPWKGPYIIHYALVEEKKDLYSVLKRVAYLRGGKSEWESTEYSKVGYKSAQAEYDRLVKVEAVKAPTKINIIESSRFRDNKTHRWF